MAHWEGARAVGQLLLERTHVVGVHMRITQHVHLCTPPAVRHCHDVAEMFI